MWYFHCSNNSLHYFWEKQNYTIGRKNTDIIITNDESISRNHALLELENNNVFLTDKGSKYGTFVGDVKLNADEKHKLHENDNIKFGLLDGSQSKFKLEKLKLTVITSNVKSNDKKELSSSLDFLKASRTTVWNKSCTHLVVTEVILTAKVLCALTEEQPIVSVKYFQDYVKSVKNNLIAPNSKDYLPEINETLLSKNIKLEYNSNRKTLFKNKLFVFLTEKCKVQMAELISVTGGKAISWEKDKFDSNILKKDSSNYIFMEEALDDINQNSEMYKSFWKCLKILSESGKRLIPLQEIALAIVHNSCEENCNPLFNRGALLFVDSTQPSQEKSEEIFAYNTEKIGATSTQKENSQMSENIPMEVMPSFETTTGSDIDISAISNNSNVFKRPLELDSTDEKEKPNKKVKEAEPAPGDLFSFRRSSTSSTQSTNISKNNMFSFPVSTNTSKPKTNNEDNIDDENPFSKKRKATKEITSNEDGSNDENPFSRKRKITKEIESVSKKTPLENISNKTKPNITPPAQLILKNNVTNKSDTSSTIIRSVWFSRNTTIKKEILNKDEKEVKVKIEDPDLEEVRLKLHEEFKNSIVIEYMPLVIKKENISYEPDYDYASHKNFKKFRKAKVPKFQTIIITDDQMSHFVVGQLANHVISDDEEVQETPEMEMIERTVQRTPQRNNPQRRNRFQFNI